MFLLGEATIYDNRIRIPGSTQFGHGYSGGCSESFVLSLVFFMLSNLWYSKFCRALAKYFFEGGDF